MPTQAAIRRWFNRTYSRAGLGYLRPSEFYSIFLEYLEARPGERLLDVGCGPGLLLGEAAKRGVAGYGVDVSERALAMVRRRVPGARVALANAQALPFRDGAFDHLTCIGTLEHFLEPDRALAEMRRVARRGARICLMVPNSRSIRWKIDAELLRRYDEDSHERAATLAEWQALLDENGLRTEAVHRDEWPGYRMRRRLLGRRSDGFSKAGHPSRHLLPLRYASQFVFLLRGAAQRSSARLGRASPRRPVIATRS